jgi:hypothetical protein
MDQEPAGSRGMKLAVVEVLDRDGHGRQFVPVWQWPVTIGRAIDCDVVLDDSYAAPRHASLTDVDGVLRLHVGDTLNGVAIGRRQIAAQQTVDLAPGDVLEVGGTRLRVRRASDPLGPERSVSSEPVVRVTPVAVLALAYVAWTAARYWVAVDPGGRLTDYLQVVLGSLLALAAWTGFWAVGSKLVRRRFDFKPHARIALAYTLVSAVAVTLLPLLAFASGVAMFSRVAGIVAGAVICALVAAHLTLIMPTRRRFVSITVAVLFAGGVSLWLARTYQARERIFNELYVTTMAPPAVRLAPAVPAAEFISEARGLKSVLDAHARDESEGADQSSDEEE